MTIVILATAHNVNLLPSNLDHCRNSDSRGLYVFSFLALCHSQYVV